MKSAVLQLAAAAMLGVAASATLVAAPVLAEDVKITVVGVGDIYAFETGKVRGGFARRSTCSTAT